MDRESAVNKCISRRPPSLSLNKVSSHHSLTLLLNATLGSQVLLRTEHGNGCVPIGWWVQLDPSSLAISFSDDGTVESVRVIQH